MKYFIVGAFATAVLLYGIALIYGAVGSTALAEIARQAPRVAQAPLFIIGMLLVLVALGFKIAAVPFHMWAPDAYEGAPTPVTAFMAAGGQGGRASPRSSAWSSTAFARTELAYGASGWASICSVLAIADDDARQPGRAAPGQHQAHAGLLVDRARRLPAGRCRGHRPSSAPRRAARCSTTSSPTPSPPSAPSAWSPGSARAATSGCSSTTGPASASRHPGGGAGDDHLHALARRHPADGGLLRQVLPVPRRAREAGADLRWSSSRCSTASSSSSTTCASSPRCTSARSAARCSPLRSISVTRGADHRGHRRPRSSASCPAGSSTPPARRPSRSRRSGGPGVRGGVGVRSVVARILVSSPAQGRDPRAAASVTRRQRRDPLVDERGAGRIDDVRGQRRHAVGVERVHAQRRDRLRRHARRDQERAHDAEIAVLRHRVAGAGLRQRQRGAPIGRHAPRCRSCGGRSCSWRAGRRARDRRPAR